MMYSRPPRALANSFKVSSLAFLIFVTITLLFTRPAETQNEPPPPPDNLKLRGRQFAPGEVLVRYRSEAIAEEQTRLPAKVRIDGREIQLKVEKIVDDKALRGLRLVRVNPRDTLKTVELLRARSDVLYAEPNYLRFQLAIPNDPLFKNLWGLHNTGTIFDSPGLTPGIDIDAERAWNITTGSRDVVVGVVDGGIEVNHIDLVDNIWRNPLDIAGNGIDEDGNGFVDDVNGFDFFHNTGSTSLLGGDSGRHGTHVAGTIGATGNNSIGVVGVNWQVSLMALKVLGDSDEPPATSTVALAVRANAYAKKMRELWISSGGTKGANIRVLNNSFGGYNRSQAEADSIKELNDAGILFVAAAGNDFRNNDVFPVYPAGYDLPNVISVAANQFTDILTSFSNVGARTVHMSAPGVTIQSTVPNSSYDTLQGTSMASPHVAGAAALICAAHPNIDVRRLRASLIYNGDFAPSQLFRTLTARRLNVFNSLNAVAENDNTPPAPIADFRLVVQNGRSLTLGWRATGDDGNSGTTSIYDIRFSENDLSSPAQFETATPISPLGIPLPSVAGSFESATVEIPFKKTRGFIGLRTTDNMGNNSPIAVLPVVSPITAAHLYDITQSAPQPLSTGGTQLPMRTFRADGAADESQILDFQLPFEFPFYGHWLRNVNISANGTLYFSPPPKFLLPPMTNRGIPLDFASSIRALQTNMMIAGMWDDLIVKTFAVTPDPDRFIVRWEGVTFNTILDDGTSRGEVPISFEIELRKNGTIVARYGSGNEKLFPVVGISGGSPEAYLVATHTSESTLKSLANANTITFTPRFPPAPVKADLQVTVVQSIAGEMGNSTALGAAVLPGDVLEYSVTVENLGPDAADNVVLTAQMPPGTTFVGCVVGASFCSGPPPGASEGLMSFQLGTLGQIFFNKASGARIQVKVNNNVSPGTTLTATLSASSAMTEADPANNSTNATALVGALTPFREVLTADGGRTFSAALKKDGTVWFWGIPPGSPETASNALATPKMIEGFSNITAFAAGVNYILALKSDGTVWSWGVNDVGQLGVGAIGNVFQSFPVRQVPGLQNVQSIAAGGVISLALKSDGTIWGWGANENGLLKGGTVSPPVTAPIHLNTISGVRLIASSGGCTYAVKQDGSVWSWSDIFGSGSCGTGTTETFPPLTWLQVSGISDVRSIKTRFNNTIAVKNDGSLWTWGNNAGGQLGDGTINNSKVPLRVTSLNDVRAVGLTDTTSLALKTDGTVWFWGFGQLTPQQVAGLANVKDINAWSGVNAAIMPDDSLQLWGNNNYGNLGNGTIGGDGSIGPVASLTVAATPIINPGSRLLVFQQDVVLTCETQGATIHYTTNGADPTQTDPGVPSGGSVRVSKSGVLKARAFLTGLSPSKITSATYVVLATDPGSIVELLLDANAGPANEAVALDSMLATRGPFSIVNSSNVLNQSTDRNTRVTVFTRKFQLLPGETATSVRVELYDANSFYFELVAEDVRAVPNTDLTQVIFRLSDNLAPGKYTTFVRAHGQTSNAGSITISSH